MCRFDSIKIKFYTQGNLTLKHNEIQFHNDNMIITSKINSRHKNNTKSLYKHLYYLTLFQSYRHFRVILIRITNLQTEPA